MTYGCVPLSANYQAMTDRREMPFSSGQAETAKAPRPLRILVCDDDRDTALTLTAILRDEGHEVTALHSGRNVLSTAIRTEPDVVVLDIHLPDVSGWQLAQTIRARRKKGPLLIGISGVYTASSDRVLANMSGFDHYLVKPYAPAELLALLAPLRDPSARQ